VTPPELLEIGKAGDEVETSVWHDREEDMARSRYFNLLVIIVAWRMQSR